MPLILGTNSIKDTGYDVANSLRFNPGSSDTLSKSFGTPTNNKKFTFSFWIKKCENSREQHVVNGGAASSQFYFNPSDKLYFYDQTAGGTYQTTQVFRDVSAWYHIVVAEDTTQGTASSRIRIYVNGSEITDFDIETDPTQNNSSAYNTAATHTIGTYAVNPSAYYLNGYLAEFVFIDGQQLDPTSFGEFDSDSPNIWKPIDVSGLTFGTNGFYLDFENASSLGADVSGNSNNFTVNNLTSVDQSTDTCTNNWCTMNPLDNYYAGATFSEGNLKLTSGSSQYSFNTSTFQMVSGKWYWEAKVNSSGAAGNYQWGIVSSPATTSSNALQNYSNSVGVNDGNDNILANGSSTGITIGSFAQNDILMFAFDADNNGLYVGKNGTWLNSGDPTSGASKTGAFTPGTSGIGYFAAFGDANGSAGYISELNFGGTQTFTISSGNSDGNGHGNFEYAVPSGYFSLCTKNLAEFG